MSIQVKTMDEFKTKLNDAGDTLVVVDFFATWCGPCKMISPKLDTLAEENKQTLIVIKVDVDECEDIATEYNISSMPTFIFIKHCNVITQFSGANYEKLKGLVQEHK